MAIEKIKILEPFWSYQLNSTLLDWSIWSNFEVNGLDWQCCVAGSSKTAPRIFIFSIVLGAEQLSDVKSLETHARTFLTLDILSFCTVN